MNPAFMKSIFTTKIYLPAVFLVSFLCSGTIINAQHYNLDSPDKITTLPVILREVSDITMLSSSAIACIQDEKGILFRFDIKKSMLVARDSFFVDGDYEGIAKVKNDLYVLRSDGVILEIKNALKGKLTVQTYTTNIPASNNEGLCYDEKNNQLLIASKSRSINVQDARDKRLIYAFDLTTKTLKAEPLMELDIPAIRSFVGAKYNMMDSVAQAIRVRPSALAIHPVNRKLYVLTATGFILCIYNQGKLEDVIKLNPFLFNKSEGITFMRNGDMLISNEAGTNAAGTLLYFKNSK
jgi:hypothetical protein